jgi:muramoyltetrapeptide carboxypeptidase
VIRGPPSTSRDATAEVASGEFLIPPPLRPGDRVRIIAASSPFDRALFFRGVGFLSERYRVEIADGALSRQGFLAGPDALRLAALDAALSDPGVRAVIAARGGYGALRIAHAARWPALREHPKWLVGFSDVTSLHLEASRVGVCSLHADNAGGLGRGDAHARSRFIEALESPGRERCFAALRTLRAGLAQGPLAGGNLTVLFSTHAAGRLRLPEGCLLFLEDVTEASYRIDRMLTALLLSGALDRVSGVVLGDFTDCSPAPHGVPVDEVLLERLGTLGVPVAAGLPVGHGAVNEPLTLGLRAELDATRGTLRLGAQL